MGYSGPPFLIHITQPNSSDIHMYMAYRIDILSYTTSHLYCLLSSFSSIDCFLYSTFAVTHVFIYNMHVSPVHIDSVMSVSDIVPVLIPYIPCIYRLHLYQCMSHLAWLYDSGYIMIWLHHAWFHRALVTSCFGCITLWLHHVGQA